jgi:tetratricopeptide (TPR) repeat protein
LSRLKEHQRHQAYLDLTEELLRCDSTRAPEILQARREFVDTGWVEWLEQAAIRQEEQGNLQGAKQIYTLRDYAARAMLQNNLGTAYSSRILGDQGQNLEQAILCHQNSLQVYTEDGYPVDWARAQHNLGIAYRGRIQGEPDANLEQAIACFHSSLRVRSRTSSASVTG